MSKKAAPKKGAARQSKEAAKAAPEATKDKHPGGRPTKYDPRFAQELLDHFDPTKALLLVADGAGAPTLNGFPLLSGFAWKIGVSRDTLHEWAKVHPEFSDAYARGKEAQEIVLVTGALRGMYNPSFAGLTAKNVLGWRDKQDTELSTKPGDPIANLMAAIAEGARLRPPGAA